MLQKGKFFKVVANGFSMSQKLDFSCRKEVLHVEYFNVTQKRFLQCHNKGIF